jgi:rod shape-determining protein MreC
MATIVLPLFLLYAHGRAPRKTTVIEASLIGITGPVQAAASRMLGGLDTLWSGYLRLVDLRGENLRLEEDNELLTAEALRAKELGLENARLRSLLNFKKARRDLQTLGAHVIGEDVSPFARVLRIELDVGSEAGLREGMPVVASRGLVGRIRQLSGGIAHVMLSVDARSSVNVKIAGKGVTGNLQGTGDEEAYTARLTYLHKAKDLAVGDALVTSGHDRVFPPGIEVGYIRSVEERQQGLYYEVQVAPAVNFSTLSEVLVITGVTGQVEPSSEGTSKAEEAKP